MANEFIQHNEDMYVQAFIDPNGDRFASTRACIGHFGGDNSIYLSDINEIQYVIDCLQKVVDKDREAKKT